MVDENRVDIEFGAKTGDLDDAFGKIRDESKGIGEQIKDEFSPATAAAVALGTAVANLGEEIAKHIAEAVHEAIFAYVEWGAEIDDLQKRIGGSAESLSELTVGLNSVGLSAGTFESIARRLPTILDQNTEKFKAAGVAYADAHGNLLPVAEVIQNINAHLSTFTAGTARNAEGVNLMGRSYYMMADLVELTSERLAEASQVAKQFGLVLSEDDLSATNEFERNTSLLQTALHGFYVEVGRVVTPALTELAIVAREMLVPAFEVFKIVIEAVAGILGAVYLGFVTLMAGIMAVSASVELVIKMVGALAEVMSGNLSKGVDAGKSAIEDYKRTLANLGGFVGNEVDRVNAGLSRMISPPGSPTSEETPTKVKAKVNPEQLAIVKAQAEADLALQREYSREWLALLKDQYDHGVIDTKEYYDKKLAAELSGIDASIKAKQKELAESKAMSVQDAGASLKLKAEQIRIAGQLNVLEAQRSELVNKNAREYRDAENQRTAAMRNTLAQEELNNANARIAMQRSNDKQALDLRQIDYAKSFELQRDAENRSFAATQQYLRAKLEADLLTSKNVAQTREAAYATEQAAEQRHQQKLTDIDHAAETERMKYTLQAQKAVQDSTATLFEDIMKGTVSLTDAFKNFANSIIASIQRIMAQRLAEQLMGGGSTGGSAVGSFLGGLFGGGKMASYDVGTNYVPNDQLALIHKGERIISASQNNPAMLGALSSGQSMTVHNNFTVAGNVDRRTQEQIASLAGLGIQRAMARNA